MRVEFTFTVKANQEIAFDLNLQEECEKDELTMDMSRQVGVIMYTLIKTDLITEETTAIIYKKLLEYMEARPNSKKYMIHILHTINSFENLTEAAANVPIMRPSDVFR